MQNPLPLILGALALGVCVHVIPVRAQGPGTTTTTVTETPPAFTHSFGSMPTGAMGESCSIVATAPKGSAAKSQQIKFVLNSVGVNGRGRAWQYFLISTGRSKSLAQVQSMFAEAFLRAPSAPAGAVLCQLGDIRYGGEVRVVSRGGGAVELIYNPAMPIGNPVLSPGETASFARLLGR